MIFFMEFDLFLDIRTPLHSIICEPPSGSYDFTCLLQFLSAINILS